MFLYVCVRMDGCVCFIYNIPIYMQNSIHNHQEQNENRNSVQSITDNEIH